MAAQGGLIGAADGDTGAAAYADEQEGAKTAAQAAAANLQAQESNPAFLKAAQTTISDLNSNNFAGAWSSALSTSGLFGTNYNSQTTDPLLQAMESSQGLQALDPTKQWTSSEDTAFYNALGSNPVYNGKTTSGLNGTTESLGQNPYSLWGSGADLTNGTDAKANNASGSDVPNVDQYAGARPTKSFLSKYGADIGALAATVVSFGVAAPALAGALAADGIASGLAAGAIAGGVMGGVNTLAVDAITGAPITAGGVLGGALGGAAGGGLVPLAGGAINNATGLGSTLSTGIAGAGIGAAKSALTGSNVGIGALSGGVAGAVQGSGVLGNIKSGVVGATGSTAAGSLATAGTNYVIGGATGLAAGALMGTPTTSQPTATQNVNMSQTQQVPSSGALQMNAPINGMYSGVSQPTSGANTSGATSTALAAGPNIFGNLSGTSVQGNNGNMSSTPTSTDTSLASTITGALPGVLQAGVGTASSLAASNAQVNADQNAITTQQNNLGNINNIWSTQQQLGQGADTALGSALGTNGQPANYSNFTNMPGYQFAVSQGTQAIQRQAAAMGNAYTPNTAAAVGQYVTGTASQDYNTYISQLMGAAGLGTTANQGLQTGSQQSSNNISQLQQNIGQAQAAGYSGVGSAASGLFGASGAGTSLINAAGKALGGGSSGSGGSSSSGGSMSANSGDTASTGVDPTTGVPYSLEDSSQGSAGSLSSGYNASDPLGIGSSTASDPSWSSVTDSTFSGSGVSGSSGLWNSVTDSGSSDIGSDATSFLGDW
jgi:hypothetical protein